MRVSAFFFFFFFFFLVGSQRFHPNMCLFLFRNLFVTCFCCLFFRNGKKERREVGGEAKGKMYGL